jgi:hypothetical protein
VLSLVFHDQSDDITGHLDKIHEALVVRGLPAAHAIHTGPLIRREQDYRWLDMSSRRSIFRVLVDFVRTCEMTHHSWVFSKRELGDSDQLVSRMSRELGALIRESMATSRSGTGSSSTTTTGRRRSRTSSTASSTRTSPTSKCERVVPADYSLFQAADLCCTLALLRQKIETVGLSSSESDFFSTPKDSAERVLKKGYFKTLDRKRFGS